MLILTWHSVLFAVLFLSFPLCAHSGMDEYLFSIRNCICVNAWKLLLFPLFALHFLPLSTFLFLIDPFFVAFFFLEKRFAHGLWLYMCMRSRSSSSLLHYCFFFFFILVLVDYYYYYCWYRSFLHVYFVVCGWTTLQTTHSLCCACRYSTLYVWWQSRRKKEYQK